MPRRGFRARAISRACLGAALLLVACTGRPSAPPSAAHGGSSGSSDSGALAVRSPSPRPLAGPRLAALLDIASEREATVVAIVGSKGLQAAELAGPGEIERLAARGVSFQLIRPANDEPPAGTAPGGELAGGTRVDCGTYYLPLAKAATTRGFATVVVGGTGKDGGATAAFRLQPVKVEPAYVAAVGGVIKRTIKRKVAATIEHAYRLDLDGNGTPEVILQATHPDLTGDPAKLKAQYYSLIVVLHDGEESEPGFVGYLQAARDFADFEVLTLDSAADVDFDGRPELLIRARHAEGWQTQVFSYDGKLKELFRSVGGEGECPEGKQ